MQSSATGSTDAAGGTQRQNVLAAGVVAGVEAAAGATAEDVGAAAVVDAPVGEAAVVDAAVVEAAGATAEDVGEAAVVDAGLGEAAGVAYVVGVVEELEALAFATEAAGVADGVGAFEILEALAFAVVTVGEAVEAFAAGVAEGVAAGDGDAWAVVAGVAGEEIEDEGAAAVHDSDSQGHRVLRHHQCACNSIPCCRLHGHVTALNSSPAFA